MNTLIRPITSLYLRPMASGCLRRILSKKTLVPFVIVYTLTCFIIYNQYQSRTMKNSMEKTYSTRHKRQDTRSKTSPNRPVKPGSVRDVITREDMGKQCHSRVDKSYKSAIQSLKFMKIKQIGPMLDHPYFHPDPNTRYELPDKDLISPVTCSNQTRIVFLILSRPEDEEMRATIRRTWGSPASGNQWPRVDFKMDVKLVFVVGTGVDLVKEDVRPGLSGDSRLKSESQVYGDVLKLNTVEDYYNLTRKVILGLRWVRGHCPDIDFVVKVDQDSFVNVPLLWQFLTHCAKNNSVFGNIMNKDKRWPKVHRTGRWSVSEDKYPLDAYPVYGSGGSYVISGDAIAKILRTYSLLPLLRIEDAFITGIIPIVAGIDKYYVQGYAFFREKPKTICDLLKNTFSAFHYGFDAVNMSDIWEKLQTPQHGTC